MRYLLDSSICIALLRDSSTAVERRLQQAVAKEAAILISSLVLCELWYGVHRSSRPTENARTLEMFLRGPIEVLRFDDQDARIAGEIRAELARSGKIIGSYDTLIAAQCVRSDSVVVTANVSEFRRVKGLRWEDWSN
jgi:tRNA(fMet)-specific endonuclease VapC